MMLKKFSETERCTIFVDRYITVHWHGNNRKHYESLGYMFTGKSEPLEVLVTELPVRSRHMVRVRCSVCGGIRRIRFDTVGRYGHTLCLSCTRANDLREMVFGQWFVERLVKRGTRNNNNIRWLCVCSCGRRRIIRQGDLVNGSSTRCIKCARSKENHPLWNPNLTEEERSNRRSYKETSKWRSSVYERDNYTCKVCDDDTGGNLNAHHLFSYRYYKKSRTGINNGITLCDTCHNEFHIWMGDYRQPTTPGDFCRWAFGKWQALLNI